MSMYGLSKLALNAYSKVKAEELRPRGIMLNTCTPGYCSTSMTSFKGDATPEEGAAVFTWLATRPPTDFVTGKMWAYEGGQGIEVPM